MFIYVTELYRAVSTTARRILYPAVWHLPAAASPWHLSATASPWNLTAAAATWYLSAT
jgi:hypothetical protein